jgi:internalin A
MNSEEKDSATCDLSEDLVFKYAMTKEYKNILELQIN